MEEESGTAAKTESEEPATVREPGSAAVEPAPEQAENPELPAEAAVQGEPFDREDAVQ
jgi:hypothetical protein